MVGHLAALHGVIHALPLTYNKDLQEDKEHLFDAVDTIELTLAAATGMLAGVRFSRERMSEAASDELLAATDIADLLVARCGVPFREAHGVVAGLVRTAVDSGRVLSELTVDELAAHSAELANHSELYYEALQQSSWLESKISEGGTSTRGGWREQFEAGAERARWPAGSPGAPGLRRADLVADRRALRCPPTSTRARCSRSLAT